jgi:hypothetical protein
MRARLHVGKLNKVAKISIERGSVEQKTIACTFLVRSRKDSYANPFPRGGRLNTSSRVRSLQSSSFLRSSPNIEYAFEDCDLARARNRHE